MTSHRAAALLIAISIASSASAQSAPAEAPKQEKKLCKSERVTGSLTRVQRICMTRTEWAEIANAARDGLAETAKRTATFNGDSNISYGPAGTPGL